MLTPGQFQVSESGAATYTIPIQVSPGVGGMEPKLSLNYSSQSGNGLLGVGWSLGGLGGVSRCPKTIAQDGVRGGVNYDGNDRFCLDGQRLIAISGSEGADGTEYRTERESFAKIVSYGSAGNGPAWFKVWTKAGQVMEYGRTTDSRVEAQGLAVIKIWALNRIEDTKGNYLTAGYTKDAVTGDFYPRRIDYTGNSKTNSPPTKFVQFVYETRPDPVLISGPGRLTTGSSRLQKVQASLENLTREYQLEYSQGPTTDRSRLTALSECIQSTCLPQIKFTWDTVQPAIQNTTWAQGAGVGDAGGQLADLFGDGRQVYWTHDANGRHYATRLFSDGTWSNIQWPLGAGVGDAGWQLADVAGEGRQLYWTHAANGVHNATRFFPDGTAENIMWPHSYGIGDSGSQMGDLFGIGRQMYWAHDNDGTHYASLLNADGTGRDWIWKKGYGNGDSGSQLVDLFGDGTMVYWAFDKNGTHYSTRLNSDGTLVNKLWTGLWGLGDVAWQFGDLFGDGHPLYWTFDKNGTHYALRFNADGSTQSWKWTGGYGSVDGGWALADVFGDGRQMFWAFDKDGRHYAMRFNPDGTLKKWTWTGGYGVGNAGWQMGDIFGSGRQLYWAHDTDGRQYATSFIASKPDQLLSIQNGSSAKVDITYLPLTDTAVYAKDPRSSATSYPLMDVQGAMYVVSSVVSANGVGGATTTNYIYGGLKSDLNGRGLLGFRWMQAKQVETGLTSYTEYQQTWPYTGLPSLIKKSLSGGGNNGLLSQVNNSYACNDVAKTTATACAVGIGKRYFVYASQSIESGWDYNSAVLPVIVTKTEYDNWGNATKVDVSTSDGYGKSTINSYSNDSSNWYLGRLIRSSVTSAAP